MQFANQANRYGSCLISYLRDNLGAVCIVILEALHQKSHFETTIFKLSFVLDIYFIWKFKFLHSTLIYFKITISKNITLLF